MAKKKTKPKRPADEIKTPPPVPDDAAAGPAHAISQETPCIQTLPDDIRKAYEIHEWWHACAVLRNDFPAEYDDVIDVLRNFRLKRNHVLEPGGRKSKVAEAIDKAFFAKSPSWLEKMFATRFIVDQATIESPTHSVDCFRNGVAVEVEWNNKDPFRIGT